MLPSVFKDDHKFTRRLNYICDIYYFYHSYLMWYLYALTELPATSSFRALFTLVHSTTNPITIYIHIRHVYGNIYSVWPSEIHIHTNLNVTGHANVRALGKSISRIRNILPVYINVVVGSTCYDFLSWCELKENKKPSLVLRPRTAERSQLKVNKRWTF